MSAEVVAKIVNIVHDEASDGYVVEFWVGQELAREPTLNEAFALLGSMDTLHRELYSFVVEWEDGEFTMEPDEALSECLAIYDKHDDADRLGRPYERMWKTGQVAESMVVQLVNSNIFGVWRTGNEDIDPAALDDQVRVEHEGG
jgi:hypothetical protein